MLLDMIRPLLGTGSTILDVGGGIGVTDHELLRAGAGHAVLVDAAPAYLEVNLGFRIRRKAYRAYAHPNAMIDRLAAANGLRPRSERATWFWRVVVYDRSADGSTN